MNFPDFDTASFLRDHWQQKPLLIRNPWGRWHNPLEPDELAGLACEEDVESRLVTGGEGEWAVEHGPIPADRFATLGADPWTLLVQAVDMRAPDVAALIDPFRFIPDWRIDDVMVSYATDDGGVGPHFDQYDVFLIQGLGRRRWRVGPLCDDGTALRPHADLRLLAAFAPTDEWVLEPGDILYIPPRFGHDGVALGTDCMTYSVGFRAPARRDLVIDWAEAVVEDMADDDRYADPDPAAQVNPGEITPAAIDRLHALLLEKLADRAAFARWFGTQNSASKYPDLDWRPEDPATTDDLQEALANGATLLRNPASRFAFHREGEGLCLFADGQAFPCTGEAAALAEHLCADRAAAIDAPADADAMALIAALHNQGSLVFEDDEEEGDDG